MKIVVSPNPIDEPRNVMALLPVDIVYYKILTKLPAKSVLRFKSVCKNWYNFINSSNFINIHYKHTLESHDYCDFLVVSKYYTLSYHGKLFNTYLDAPNYSIGKSVEFENFDSTYRIIGSSNGLICIKFLKSGFLLCNPVTRECSRLIESHSLASVPFNDQSYGFGYDVVSHGYKIVNIEFRDNIVLVYNTDNSSWKQVQINHPDLVRKYYSSGRGVVVNNKLHWIMIENNINPITRIILTFDLHTEEFRELSFPTSLINNSHDATGELELMVSPRGCRQSTLLATYYPLLKNSNVSVWVMKEYGVVESWTKLYEVVGEQIPSEKYFQIITHLSRRDSEEVLLLRDGKELEWYSLENKSITRKANDRATTHIYGEGDYWVCISSLAPIPGNDPNKCGTSIF